jgi:hypothetical protein
LNSRRSVRNGNGLTAFSSEDIDQGVWIDRK